MPSSPAKGHVPDDVEMQDVDIESPAPTDKRKSKLPPMPNLSVSFGWVLKLPAFTRILAAMMEGDINELVSVEGHELIMKPHVIKQDTLIALSSGISKMRNVRIGKCTIRLPDDLNDYFTYQRPVQLSVHIESLEADTLNLPAVMPADRIDEVLREIFGPGYRSGAKRRFSMKDIKEQMNPVKQAQKLTGKQRRKSMTAEEALAEGRSKKDPTRKIASSADEGEAQLLCAETAIQFRVLVVLESLPFCCLLLSLIFASFVLQIYGKWAGTGYTKDMEQQRGVVDSNWNVSLDGFGDFLYVFEILLSMFLIFEICLRFLCYNCCYKGAFCSFWNWKHVRGKVNCFDTALCCIDGVRIMLEWRFMFGYSIGGRDFLEYWRMLRILRLVGVIILYKYRVEPKAQQLAAAAYAAAIRTVDGMTVTVDKVTLHGIGTTETMVEDWLARRTSGDLDKEGVDADGNPFSGDGEETTELRDVRVMNVDPDTNETDGCSLHDALVQGLTVPGAENEPAVCAHKRISIAEYGISKMDRRGMRTPTLRPIHLQLDCNITRRCSDSLATDMSVDVFVPKSISMVRQAWPVSTRMHIGLSVAATKERSRTASREMSGSSNSSRRMSVKKKLSEAMLEEDGVDEWFDKSIQAAHAAVMWEIFFKWLGGGRSANRISSLFDELDLDGDGFITYDELRTVLERHDIKVDDDVFQALARSINVSEDGQITPAEFSAYVTGDNGARPNLSRSMSSMGSARTIDELASPAMSDIEQGLFYDSWVGGQVMKAMTPYLRLMIDGYDEKIANGGPNPVHCTPDGFSIDPVDLDHSTICALQGGITTFGSIRMGKARFKIPRLTQLIPALGGGAEPIELHLEYLEAEMLPYPEVMSSEMKNEIRHRFATARSPGGDGGAPPPSAETKARKPEEDEIDASEVLAEAATAAAAPRPTTYWESVFGFCPPSETDQQSVLNKSKDSVRAQREKLLKPYSWKHRLIDGVCISIDRVKLHRVKPTPSSRARLAGEKQVETAQQARDEAANPQQKPKARWETDGADREVVELNGVSIANVNPETGEVITEEGGLELFTQTLNEDDEGNGLVVAHKRITIAACSMARIDSRGMQTPELRPFSMTLKTVLTRRLEDSALADIDVTAELPPKLSMLMPKQPVSTRMNFGLSLVDATPNQGPLATDDEDWFDQSINAAHAAEMWGNVHKWLGDTEDRWLSLFDELDTGSKGKLSYADIAKLLQHFDLQLDASSFTQVMNTIDRDKDGLISRVEFADYVKSVV